MLDVQELTTAEPTSPDLTVRPAVLNISDVCNSRLYLRRMKVTNIMPGGSQQVSKSGHRELVVVVEYRQLTEGEGSTQAQDDAIANALVERYVHHVRVRTNELL